MGQRQHLHAAPFKSDAMQPSVAVGAAAKVAEPGVAAVEDMEKVLDRIVAQQDQQAGRGCCQFRRDGLGAVLVGKGGRDRRHTGRGQAMRLSQRCIFPRNRRQLLWIGATVGNEVAQPGEAAAQSQGRQDQFVERATGGAVEALLRGLERAHRRRRLHPRHDGRCVLPAPEWLRFRGHGQRLDPFAAVGRCPARVHCAAVDAQHKDRLGVAVDLRHGENRLSKRENTQHA